MSAPVLSDRPKKISSGEVSSILTWNWVTSTTSASNTGPNGEIWIAVRVATPEDADADPEEGRHQQEVPEVTDVDDLCRDPADEQQLDEEDRRRRQE